MTITNLLRPTEAQRSYVLDLLEWMTPTERERFLEFGRELIDAEPFDDDPRPAA